MRILIHTCCSNCATYPFKILKDEGHEFAGFWFNPNIHPFEEYSLRLDSLKTLANRWLINVHYVEEYRPEEYFRMFDAGVPDEADVISGGFESKESLTRPERCRACYRLRLERTAQEAEKRGFEALSTTLLISPYQEFDQIVSLGSEIAQVYGLVFFYRDFRPFFRDSGVLSRELGLYRQKYCGCIYSREARNKKREKPTTQTSIT